MYRVRGMVMFNVDVIPVGVLILMKKSLAGLRISIYLYKKILCPVEERESEMGEGIRKCGCVSRGSSCSDMGVLLASYLAWIMLKKTPRHEKNKHKQTFNCFQRHGSESFWTRGN